MICLCYVIDLQEYAEKQFPGNPEQQAVLIHQLQQEHYHQYMQQLHMQNHNNANLTNNNISSGENGDGTETLTNSKQQNENDLSKELEKLSIGNMQQQQHYDENQQLQTHNNDDDDDYVLIQPAKIWTRPDIAVFKAEVSAGDGDGVITIGHGDTVTVSY